jgi:hypothetical protein
MSQILKRVECGIESGAANQEGSPDLVQYRDPVKRQADGLTVVCRANVGVDPGVLIQWNVAPPHWAKRFRLLGFRSTTGLAANRRTRNLDEHGQLIIDEQALGGQLEERLPEGTYFYTFLLHRPVLCGMREELSDPVRFSETIPSARTAIGRVEDRLKLQQLREDLALRGVRAQIAANEAEIALQKSNKKLDELRAPKPADSIEAEVRREVEVQVKKKLKRAMTRVELVVALQDVQRQLKRSSGWKRLSQAERDQLLKDVIGDFDASEAFFDPDQA